MFLKEISLVIPVEVFMLKHKSSKGNNNAVITGLNSVMLRTIIPTLTGASQTHLVD